MTEFSSLNYFDVNLTLGTVYDRCFIVWIQNVIILQVHSVCSYNNNYIINTINSDDLVETTTIQRRRDILQMKAVKYGESWKYIEVINSYAGKKQRKMFSMRITFKTGIISSWTI